MPREAWNAGKLSRVAFVIEGFIARLESAASALPVTSGVSLAKGYTFFPLPERDSESAVAGFSRLTEEAAAAARALSADGRVVYVEAEFFAGTGTQGAVGWQDGRTAFGPRLTQTPGEDRDGYDEVEADSDWAINGVLRWLGVEAAPDQDEFDTLGLAQLR